MVVVSRFCCVAAQVFPDLDSETRVNITGLGMVQGRLAGGDYMYRAFRGLPFAEPPVGPRRFQPPVPKLPWAPRVLQAGGYGDMCTQRWPRDRGLKHGTSSARPDSEDCLVLDVYTPRRNASRPPPTDGFPVWFFVHGGANEGGNAGGGLFAPDGMFANNLDEVVIVTAQYRLGIFGWLGSRELQQHTADGSAGNFGLQDQRMGLEWVKQHIAAFVSRTNSTRSIFIRI